MDVRYDEKEKYLEYRNAHYPRAFQFTIKCVQESIDNLHFLTWVTKCTEVNLSIYVLRGTTSAVYFMYKFKVELVSKLEKSGTEKVKIQEER